MYATDLPFILTVQGHAGRLVIGKLGAVTVVCMQVIFFWM